MQKGGAGGRIRTPDLLITNQLLYQLSYTSTQRHFLNSESDYIRKKGDCQYFFSMTEKNFLSLDEGGAEVHCALCRGELYPGDRYFLLEDRRVCEACLERYARNYFARQCRRLSASEREVR